ncbi:MULTISPECIES: threonine ammonia-lyase [unclassified Nitratiruptor]|uniref:threonine ammonia-lyase n=1 Tax=unclassified Nitratiruptor TaxID=2624044 RepID=UPI0019168F7B|nr:MULTISPECIES: threonine ammonia-lyase [unclassified Nitratiruptor]BCD60472.1 threonine dehydratase [Nitratiruptor sp. YY08-10]BCD64039.1 threonine dehydratase [Nitratiruptor sp. YY08-14]
MIELKKIEEARKRIEPVISRTPYAYAPILSKRSGKNVYLKKENLQVTGAFKLRGAFNKIASLENKEIGVVAASAGNHAQGVAFSANYFAIPATIVMPENTPLTKVNGVKAYGAEVILHGSNYDEAYLFAVEYAKQKEKIFVHPFADYEVMAGQGTIALEILEEAHELDAIVVPIGGGGLIAGIASAVQQINPSIQVIGVTAAGAPAMRNSYQLGKPVDSTEVKTIADGIAVRDTSKMTLDIILETVDDIVEVDDEEIADAILLLLEKQKLLVEGAGAVGVAALLYDKVDLPEGANVAVLLSGGNIDVTMLNVIIEKGLIKSYRKMKLIVTLVDKPGSLMKLTELLAKANANIVQIGYDRTSAKLAFGDANVSIGLETKGKEHQEEIRTLLSEHGYRFYEER